MISVRIWLTPARGNAPARNCRAVRIGYYFWTCGMVRASQTWTARVGVGHVSSRNLRQCRARAEEDTVSKHGYPR